MIAYLDESGGHGFNFKSAGTSTHFVVCSIIVEDDADKDLKRKFTEVKEEFFPHSELKSSKIGKDDARRQRILEKVEGLDFKIFCLVVDKRKININTGLQYKEPFYKFLYGIIYNAIYRTFPKISVVADNLISPDFASGFEKYIKEYHVSDLFNQSEIEFGRSDENILLQLADIIGGSVNRFFSKKSALNPLDVLKEHIMGVVPWPNTPESYIVTEVIGDEYEKEIADLALLRIKAYIDKNVNNNDKLIKLRVMFLSYLEGMFRYVSSTRFIHTSELLNHFNNTIGERINEQYLRQHIVGPLRSEGVLIVSNINGYKVPNSVTDIVTFFNLFSKIINPMVLRLKKSHEALFLATNGKLDILSYPEYGYLKKIIED